MKIPKYFYFRVHVINKGISVEIEGASDVDVAEIVRCRDCKWHNEPGCAISIVDDSDRPGDEDYCSFGERKYETD